MCSSDLTGWTGEDTAKGRAWLTQVIYETNLMTAYQAGRWAQVQAVKERRPYLEYRHSDLSLHPRKLHKSWDGLVVAVDDPWVRTHWPPNGWGCKCRMFALADRDLRRMGKSGPDMPPDDGSREWTDRVTGETHTVPNGIDPSWDYAPGASRTDLMRGEIERKAARLPAGIGQALQDDAAFIRSAREAEGRALALGIRSADFRQSGEIGDIVTNALQELKGQGVPLPDHVSIRGDLFDQWSKHIGVDSSDLVASISPNRVTGEAWLFLNPGYPFWANPAEDARMQHAKGHWSSSDPMHIIRHEMGHLTQYKKSEADYMRLSGMIFSPEEAAIAARVSAYAAESPREFVAEVFAAKLAQAAFDDEVMQLYRRLGGPGL